ncbi:hypothetical protein SAMN06264346_102196 [Chryseobacterium profundimaris]|uniref:Uncharacterized protein n=1 Tax=Chryseobacterium profundimaris TaxID=1387275 RepID=A0ABY1NI54_9FLAO|nr:hypothetical protein SAMN06264346_102196 [Chryseobacterium profundimaris]
MLLFDVIKNVVKISLKRDLLYNQLKFYTQNGMFIFVLHKSVKHEIFY